jgi:hypothetical protein
MRFLSTFFWEFMQNLPLVAGFILALKLWGQGKWPAAVACILAGSVAGSLIIRATESKIVAGHREPVRVVVANVMAMAMLMSVAVAYLAADWSSWGTDLLVGAVAGVAVGAIQDLVIGEPVGIRHCVALGCSAPIALVSARMFVAALSVWAGALIVTVVVTLIVGLVDYGSLLS